MKAGILPLFLAASLVAAHGSSLDLLRERKDYSGYRVLRMQAGGSWEAARLRRKLEQEGESKVWGSNLRAGTVDVLMESGDSVEEEDRVEVVRH